MAKYELSLSRDYVPDWTIVDGVREIFQNALDQQTTVEDNEMFFDYDEESQILSIGNKKSVLNPSTLLLGSSSKRGDDNTIGQFGEGYKVATLVLTRNDKQVIFYNYGAKEVWRPRFVKSRRYNADVLTFFTDKKYIWNKVPHSNLIITIDNISKEEHLLIMESNLHLSPAKESIETEFGQILLDEDQKGKVYVNGLFVCEHEPYQCGYNFRPSHIKLDRDRKLVSDFHLQWLASKMWSKCDTDEMTDKAAHLAMIGAADVKFLTDVTSTGDSTISKVATKAFNSFIDTHGVNAIPIHSTSEMDGLLAKYNPIIVTESYATLLKSSPFYIEPMRVRAPSLKDRVTYWLEEHQNQLDTDAYDQLKEILEDTTYG